MIFGAHCSTAGGFYKALERAEKIKAECVQIFVKNNMQWAGRPPAPEDIRRFSAEWKRLRLASVFGHTGYLINLGAPPSPNRAKSLQSLVQEITFAAALGLPFLVLHPGAHLGAGEEAGLGHVVAGLDEVTRATRDAPVRIALENTAGQGSCLGNWNIWRPFTTARKSRNGWPFVLTRPIYSPPAMIFGPSRAGTAPCGNWRR